MATIVLNKPLLNPDVVEQQGIDMVTQSQIQSLHVIREAMFYAAEHLDPEIPKELAVLQALVQDLRGLEYNMQRLWGFKRQQSMHSWWYQMPHCVCGPDHFAGFDIEISPDCPIHSGGFVA